MFFKKIFISFIFLILPSISVSQIFTTEFTCFTDIKKFSPEFLTGSLSLKKQKRLFRCLHDTLQLWVEKEIFIHDSRRDHFIKPEIFKMFNNYFKYDKETSQLLTKKIFIIKKLLIGGSVDELKDQEIQTLYRLIKHYEDIYFILNKTFPIIKKTFHSKDLTQITLEEKTKALNKLSNAFTLLYRAYKKESINYSLKDIGKYAGYLHEAQWITKDQIPFMKQFFSFIQNMLEGVIYPKTHISQEDWRVVLQALHIHAELFFYHKTYITKTTSQKELIYRIIEMGKIFLSLLKISPSMQKEGFPLNNLDSMLSTMLSFIHASTQGNTFISKIFKSQAVPLFTRTASCFSVNTDKNKPCTSKWNYKTSDPIVTLSFSDSTFVVSSDKITKILKPKSPSMMLKADTWKFLTTWLQNYKKHFLNIHKGDISKVFKKYENDHLFLSFFGLKNLKSRVEFGFMYENNLQTKAHYLLNHQMFTSLLFSSYLPKDFFSSDSSKQNSLSYETWTQMVRDISPLFLILQGNSGYKVTWKKSLLNLFNFSDSFLYSSNRDGYLNSKEFTEMVMHALEGIKTEQLALNFIHRECGLDASSQCAINTLISQKSILSVYPKFQKTILNPELKQAYIKRISKIIETDKQDKTQWNLIPLFVLIQSMELNYNFIDINQSSKLDLKELSIFAQKFEEQLVEKIFYLSNRDQAKAYLIYMFKTGDIPFFDKQALTPLQFTKWYIQYKKKPQNFTIDAKEFYLFLLDLYILFQNN